MNILEEAEKQMSIKVVFYYYNLYFVIAIQMFTIYSGLTKCCQENIMMAMKPAEPMDV